MPIVLHLSILGLLLIGLLTSLKRMGQALNEADLGSFLIWTSIASVMAGLPSKL